MHAKRTYYKNVFNSYSTNLKKTWQTINESLNRQKKKQDFLQAFKLANGNLFPIQNKLPMLSMIFSLTLVTLGH